MGSISLDWGRDSSLTCTAPHEVPVAQRSGIAVQVSLGMTAQDLILSSLQRVIQSLFNSALDHLQYPRPRSKFLSKHVRIGAGQDRLMCAVDLIQQEAAPQGV